MFYQVALTATHNDNGFVTMFFLAIPVLSALLSMPLSRWIPDLRFFARPMFFAGMALVTGPLLLFSWATWRLETSRAGCGHLRLEDQPAALDRIALEPLEKAHAEQAFAERAGPRHQRAHVAHARSGRRTILSSRVGAAIAAPLAVTTLTSKSSPAESMPTLAASFGAQHHGRGAGVEDQRDRHIVDLRRDDEFAAEPPVDDDLAAAPDRASAGMNSRHHAVGDVGEFEPIGVDAGQADDQQRPDRAPNRSTRATPAAPARRTPVSSSQSRNAAPQRRARETGVVEPEDQRVRRATKSASQRGARAPDGEDQRHGGVGRVWEGEASRSRRRTRAPTRPAHAARAGGGMRSDSSAITARRCASPISGQSEISATCGRSRCRGR